MALLTAGGGSDAALVFVREEEEERLDEEGERREMPPPQSETRESDADFAAVAFRTPMQTRCPIGSRDPIIELRMAATVVRERGGEHGRGKEGRESNAFRKFGGATAQKITLTRASTVRVCALRCTR